MAIIAIYLFSVGDKTDAPTRVALALGPIQHLAPPNRAPATQPVAAEAGKAPALRDGGAPDEPPSAEAKDMLADEGAEPPVAIHPDADNAPLEQPAKVTITIDGAPAPDASAQAAPPRLAAYAAPKSFAPPPDAALEQSTRFGPIPKIAADGRRASTYYALPDPPDASQARVALIVSGLGLNAALTERAIEELPPEVTLSFAPYARNLDQWTKKAREAGHEIMIELPMEGYGGDDSALGPAALLTSRTPKENLQRLDWLLSRFQGYFAATNYLGGKFASDEAALSPVLARLRSAGVAYVDDTGAARRMIGGVATVDRIVTPGDGGDDEKAAARDLDDLATIARNHGAALGKTYAYPASIDAIVDWASGLSDREVTLAPASALIAAR